MKEENSLGFFISAQNYLPESRLKSRLRCLRLHTGTDGSQGKTVNVYNFKQCFCAEQNSLPPGLPFAAPGRRAGRTLYALRGGPRPGELRGERQGREAAGKPQRRAAPRMRRMTRGAVLSFRRGHGSVLCLWSSSLRAVGAGSPPSLVRSLPTPSCTDPLGSRCVPAARLLSEERHRTALGGTAGAFLAARGSPRRTCFPCASGGGFQTVPPGCAGLRGALHAELSSGGCRCLSSFVFELFYLFFATLAHAGCYGRGVRGDRLRFGH